MKKKIGLFDVIVVGLMAAIVFVVTEFLSIRIPTPTGQTMIKLANAFCILSGILFGGLRGGLAAGIGSMLYDFTDPAFAAEAWITFIRFFLMGATAGWISHIGSAAGRRPAQNLVASLVAALVSTFFYIFKNTFVAVLAGSAFLPALIGELPKVATSLVNIIIAVMISTILAPVLRKALDSAHIYERLGTAGSHTS